MGGSVETSYRRAQAVSQWARPDESYHALLRLQWCAIRQHTFLVSESVFSGLGWLCLVPQLS